MVQCSECKWCRILETENRRWQICQFKHMKYEAFDDRQEIDCPNFNLRSCPSRIEKATADNVWEILLPSHPPFAKPNRKRTRRLSRRSAKNQITNTPNNSRRQQNSLENLFCVIIETLVFLAIRSLN